MDLPIHCYDYHGVRIHTLVRRGRPCWLLSEIGLALGRPDLDITYHAPVDREDVEVVPAGEADDLRKELGAPVTAGPLVVLYEIGLAIACTTALGAGAALRQLLLGEAAHEVKRALRRARLEHRVREVVRQIETEDRTRKAALLHRLVEHGRRSGALQGDDRSYVLAMALVAETATGLVFPVDVPREEAIAGELGEDTDAVRGALVALCEEINT